MMKRKTSLVMAIWLALAAGFLMGCEPDNREAVETERDAQGKTTIHVDGDEVERELDQAGERLEAAGDQVAQGAQQMAKEAERVGEAIERGAQKVEKEVGPILDDAAITARRPWTISRMRCGGTTRSRAARCGCGTGWRGR